MNRFSIGIRSPPIKGTAPGMAAIAAHTVRRRGNKRSISCRENPRPSPLATPCPANEKFPSGVISAPRKQCSAHRISQPSITKVGSPALATLNRAGSLAPIPLIQPIVASPSWSSRTAIAFAICPAAEHPEHAYTIGSATLMGSLPHLSRTKRLRHASAPVNALNDLARLG
jgi:hypothetical protein